MMRSSADSPRATPLSVIFCGEEAAGHTAEIRIAAARSEARRVKRLLLDIILLSFVDQDLQSFLSQKWNHHQSAYSIPPVHSHARVDQQSNEQHHREIGVSKGKNGSTLQSLT